MAGGAGAHRALAVVRVRRFPWPGGGACAGAERPWQRCPAGHVVLLPNRLLVPEPGGRLRARPGAASSAQTGLPQAQPAVPL